MFISEKDYKKLCTKMGIKNKDIPKKTKKIFDSLAEENFYYLYIVERLSSGFIQQCEIHNEFTVLNEIKEYKLRKKVFKPDFYIVLNDGRTFVIEMKGKKIKKLQRDYGLRKHLFIEKYCLPNKWTFIELQSEDWTQQPNIERMKDIFQNDSNII